MLSGTVPRIFLLLMSTCSLQITAEVGQRIHVTHASRDLSRCALDVPVTYTLRFMDLPLPSHTNPDQLSSQGSLPLL